MTSDRTAPAAPSPRPLELDRLLPGPGQDPRLAGAPVEVLDAVDSTNEELVRRLASGEGSAGHLLALLTEHQVAGKGRRDRVWQSPRHSAGIVSFLVRPADSPRARAEGPSLPPQSLHWLTLLLALAGRRAIRETTGLPAQIKWPNDLLVRGKKVAGILARVTTDPSGSLCVVVGMGMNANIDAAELPVDTATSLLTEAGREVDRTELMVRTILAFRALYEDFERAGGDPAASPEPGAPSLLDTARAATDTIGRRVRVERTPPQENLVGRAEGLDADGGLLVRTDDGSLETVTVGDVVHLRPAAGTWAEPQDGVGTRAGGAA